MRFLPGSLALVLLCCTVGICVQAQISPGPLARAHRMLEGATHCSDCHTVGKGPGAFRCTSCHADIRQRVDQKRGFHGTMSIDSTHHTDGCTKCHSDHNGEDFDLVRWDRPLGEFDHRVTGYLLEGRHAQLECRKCHTGKNIPSEQADNISVKDLNRTYLGLSQSCTSCHADAHRGQLSLDCRDCHNFQSWKEVPLFAHARTKYRLSGAHERLACGKCHQTVEAPEPYVKYTGLPHENCTPCHADRHRGAFPATDCSSCHTSIAWKPLRDGSKFDHGSTKFPLAGKHAEVLCRACHPGSNFKQPVSHAKCSDCHRKDPHESQFRAAGRDPDCSHCHAVEGFKPALYDVAKHAGTVFPLQGKHRQTPCTKCHLPRGPATVYKVDGTRCSNCHREQHPGQPVDDFAAKSCENCHTPDSFVPSTFALRKHASTRFPLSGAHSAVICGDCHRKQEGESAVVVRSRLHLGTLACAECHDDPHSDQFNDASGGRNGGNGAPGCLACHTTDSWTTLAGFDHARTDFSLEGAHRRIPCVSCHGSPGRLQTLQHAIFGSAPRLCSRCHADIHGNQFQIEKRQKNCADCHGLVGWRPAHFDHNTSSSYRLTGAHNAVRCAQCHSQSRQVNSRTIRVYTPTPRSCGECHSEEKSE